MTEGTIETLIYRPATISNICVEPVRIPREVADKIGNLDELQQRLEKESKKHRWKKPERKIKPRRYHK